MNRRGYSRRSVLVMTGGAAVSAFCPAVAGAGCLAHAHTPPAAAETLDALDDIICVVATAHGLTREVILSAERLRRCASARQVGMYLAHRLSGLSLSEIGHRFGGRSAMTVVHAVHKYDYLHDRHPREFDVVADLAMTAIRDIEANGHAPKSERFLEWREQFQAIALATADTRYVRHRNRSRRLEEARITANGRWADWFASGTSAA